jgi:hypothetical protein
MVRQYSLQVYNQLAARAQETRYVVRKQAYLSEEIGRSWAKNVRMSPTLKPSKESSCVPQRSVSPNESVDQGARLIQV